MFVTIARYPDPIEAHIACGRLCAEGIEAHVADDQIAVANWEWRLAVGGVKLRVPQEQAMRARDILHAAESGEYVLDDDGDTHESTADERALHAPDRESWSSRLAWVALMLFSVPLPWRRKPAADQQATREV